MEEVGGVAGVPAAEPVVEVELHEVARDGGDEHVAGAAADGVVELEDAVVPRPALPRPHPPRGARQDLRHGLRHRRLLRHVQHADRAAAAGMHRERRGSRGGKTGEGAGGFGLSGWFLKFLVRREAKGGGVFFFF